jgi:uncharacterized protein YdhG (YjbR/CyaY superfamily)
MKTTGIPKNIDEYISSFHDPVRKKLNELRTAINLAAPEAEEKISYQMPAFALNGILVYFAAQSHHIGFYPTSSGVKAFSEELSGYKTGKGSIQFPLDKPLPLGLIRRIVKFRLMENLEKAAIKAGKR